MKIKLAAIFASLILLAPLSAGAVQCCLTPPQTSTGIGISIIPGSCSIKTSACVFPNKEIDCASDSSCSNATAPVGAGSALCCVYKYSDTTKKNFCYESADTSYACTLSQPNGTTYTPVYTKCTEVADCLGEKGNILAPSTSNTPSGSSGQAPEFPIIAPKIPLNIPTVDTKAFLNVKQEDGYIFIPFISVFLVGAYKLGVGVAAVLAVIMIMVGGFIWIAAAGDSGKIGKAKTMISGAVVGLMLTVGAYVFLQTVNPNLVNFTALKIPVLNNKDVTVIDDYDPEIDETAATTPTTTPKPVSGGKCPGVAKTGTNGEFDPIFQKYAPCAGITWEALKAVAKVESGLNANKSNPSGYVGLFQTKSANCPQKVSSYCSDLCNPENNTAAGAAMIAKSVDYITRTCPTASAHDQMVMIYIGHNMGYGMLQTVTKQGCRVDQMRQAAINAYATLWPATAKSYSHKYQLKCINDGKSEAECTGGPKFDFAVNLANKYSGDQVIASSPGTCPY